MSQNREINEAWYAYTDSPFSPDSTDVLKYHAFRAGWLASQRARERAAFAELLEIEGDED